MSDDYDVERNTLLLLLPQLLQEDLVGSLLVVIIEVADLVIDQPDQVGLTLVITILLITITRLHHIIMVLIVTTLFSLLLHKVPREESSLLLSILLTKLSLLLQFQLLHHLTTLLSHQVGQLPQLREHLDLLLMDLIGIRFRLRIGIWFPTRLR